MLHLALGRLCWTPAAVWRATPREIAFAFGRPSSGGALLAADLALLMRQFPDA